MKITKEAFKSWREHMVNEEKSTATVNKYLRDAEHFAEWAGNGEVTKGDVLAYKEMLMSTCAPSSVNSHISSINSFFTFAGEEGLRVKTVKIQQRIFSSAERELTKSEYNRLLAAAEKKGRRLLLIMQTICASGIRVSELRFITVESVKKGSAEIRCKGKLREVFLPQKLCRELTKYIKEKKIKSGSVFVSKNGKPLDRSNIWSDMKKLCEAAGVAREKVFPHNLRHLFARTYYALQKDIVRLADILGHSSVNTTRIYTMESGATHRRQIQSLGLLLC